MSDPGTVDVKIVLGPNATLPAYQSSGAAGVDLHASVACVIAPMQRVLVPTGIKVAIPEGFEGQVRARSGLAIKQGLALVNAPGTIDSDYRGEVKVIVINLGEAPIEIAVGDRIAQLVFLPIVRANWEQCTSLDESERGGDGFGSTGNR